ncbi:MAG: PD-(D/E)XK nuclease family protein, partial [Alphaproteobacteria bacterium]|nr:PD-(D/E)XK nuclease family protein [Alphaproteobacteria bacterium]
LKDSIPAFLSLTDRDRVKIEAGHTLFEKIDKNLWKFDGEENTFEKHLDLLLQNFKRLTNHTNTVFNTLFEDIKNSGHDWTLSANDFLKTLPAFLQKISVKKTFNTDADALILGPIEARMQEADLIILSGLNENNFPRPTQDDPILNEAMRTQLGLPSLSRKIGLMALDFATAFSKQNILLTRTTVSGGSPTQPSRFTERIEALLNQKMPESPFLEQAIHLDEGGAEVKQSVASFSPPIHARPNRLSASSVEMWMRDPYAFYAKYILKLYAPDEFENKKESLLFGNVIHDALENLAKLNTWSEKEILTALQKGIQPLHLSISQKLFWMKKAEKIARFLSLYEADLPPHKKFIEIWGEIKLNEKIKLTAKADRIQKFDDGTFEIIDYKTGALPSPKEMNSGLSPQLPLEALIAERGGFEGITGTTKSLTYLRLGQGKKASEDGLIASFQKDLDQIKEKTHQNLAKLCLKAEDETYAYTANRENAKEKYTEYRHLERLTEE